MKALGTGWRRGVKWVDLEVVRETSGRPTLAITGEAAKIAQQMGTRFHEAIVRMFATAREPLTTDPQLVTSMLEGMMVGVSRRMLESGAPLKQFDSLLRELIVVACAYLDACTARVSVQV